MRAISPSEDLIKQFGKENPASTNPEKGELNDFICPKIVINFCRSPRSLFGGMFHFAFGQYFVRLLLLGHLEKLQKDEGTNWSKWRGTSAICQLRLNFE